MLEIDVAVESTDSLGLISCLGKTRRPREGIWANSGAHVEVLSIQSMGPMRDWLLLSVISLRDSLPQLFVWALLESPPGSVLNDKLFISLIHTNICTILGDHHSPADDVLGVAFTVVRRPRRRLKVPLFLLHFTRFVFLLEFSHDLSGDLHF